MTRLAAVAVCSSAGSHLSSAEKLCDHRRELLEAAAAATADATAVSAAPVLFAGPGLSKIAS